MSLSNTSKNDIMEATIESSGLHGLENLTTAKIAKSISVSESLIYKYFANKDMMVIQSFYYLCDLIDEELKETISKHQDSPDIYSCLINTYLDFFIKNPLKLVFFNAFRHSHFFTIDVQKVHMEHFEHFLKYAFPVYSTLPKSEFDPALFWPFLIEPLLQIASLINSKQVEDSEVLRENTIASMLSFINK